MLRFQNRVDACFQAIVDTALASEADELRDFVGSGEPKTIEPDILVELHHWFDASQLLDLINRLLEAHRAPELHGLNDWHHLVIYRVLEGFVEVHNDQVPDAGPWEIGEYTVGKIDFDRVIEAYFWDTDFLVDPDVFDALPLNIRSNKEFKDAQEQGTLDLPINLDFSDEVFGIIHKMSPHREELELKPIDDQFSGEQVCALDEMFRAGHGYPFSHSSEDDEM